MDNQQSAYEEKAKLQQKITEIENLAKQNMTKEAIMRYGALKSAHPQKAIQSAAIIAQLTSEKEFKEKITDSQFKQILLTIEPEKREIKIRKI